MKLTRLAVTLILVLLSISSFVDFGYSESKFTGFRYMGLTSSAGPNEEGLFILDIDPGVFAAMDSTLRDLRIYNSQRKETGYARIDSSAFQNNEIFQELQVINQGLLRDTNKKIDLNNQIAPFTITQSEDKNVSTILVDLGQKNLNSISLKLLTDEKNFFRQASLSASNDGQEWTPLSTFFLYRGIDESDENTGDTYRLTQSRYLKVTVQNQDNAPVKFSQAMVEVQPVRVLVKDSAGSGPYNLFWGNEKLSNPSYDVPDIVRQSKDDLSTLPVVHLKTYQENPEYIMPNPPLTERFPFLLPAALALAVGTIGYIQFRSFRKVQ